MSGHSKWSTIKRSKAVTDQRRGNLFTKLSKNISIAAKQGGGDQDMNFKLRLAVEKAKNSNMPHDNINRAIKRGTGELKDMILEEVIYEGFGPEGIAIIIEMATDNKNRSASAIRSIFTKNNGHLGNSGSVLWMFSQKGIIRILKENIHDKDEFELGIIDNGAEDIIEEEEGFIIISTINSFQKIKEYIEKQNINFESADIEMLPNEKIKINNEKLKIKLQKLFDALEDNEDVNNYYTNADF